MGGVSHRRIAEDLAIRAVTDPAHISLRRILFFVVAVLALITEVIPYQADGWIVAVIIVKPYFVVDNLAQAVAAYFAQAAVHGHTVGYISGSCSPPWLALVKLPLVHIVIARAWLRPFGSCLSPQGETKRRNPQPPYQGFCHGLRRSTLWPRSICRMISVLQSRQKTGRQSAWVSGVIRSNRLFLRQTGQVIHPFFIDSVLYSDSTRNIFSSISFGFVICSTKLQVLFLFSTVFWYSDQALYTMRSCNGRRHYPLRFDRAHGNLPG